MKWPPGESEAHHFVDSWKHPTNPQIFAHLFRVIRDGAFHRFEASLFRDGNEVRRISGPTLEAVVEELGKLP